MDKITPERRSENMRRIRSANTKPEFVVRKLLTSLGYRYRLHCRDLPGKPDLVFRSRKKAVFVHGCFWHQHPSAECKIVRVPKSALNYWQPKLARNVARDAEHLESLRKAGWKTFVIWECQVKDAESLIEKLKRFLGEP